VQIVSLVKKESFLPQFLHNFAIFYQLQFFINDPEVNSC